MASLLVEIEGPDFVASANKLASQIGVNTIAALTVYQPSGALQVAALKPALLRLKSYLEKDAGVFIFAPSMNQEELTDLANACGIRVMYQGASRAYFGGCLGPTATAADGTKTASAADLGRYTITPLAGMSSVEIPQDITAGRSKSQDKPFGTFDEYIRR